MSVFKEKIACLGSQRLREHAIFELCNQISSQKRKNWQNHFCLFIWGPGRIFYEEKKLVENLVTHSL